MIFLAPQLIAQQRTAMIHLAHHGHAPEGPGKMTIHSALSAHRARAKPGRRVISQCAELGL